ncbi:hypothetical protein BDZ89DRAFT_1133879 [Hymenopellis radicata]|nr:hypothetical protein BDZ89DRAFT_1133879 [Hymenopellis radicata]
MFMLKFSVNLLFAVAVLTSGATAAVHKRTADNDIDACNGSNHYDVGHSCAFADSQGSEGYLLLVAERIY